MSTWAWDTVFYHIYPLGLCDVPFYNNFQSPPEARLGQIYPWIEHLRTMGINGLYLGPVFESSTHGYDTADYYQVDRRLGCNSTLAELITALHRNGIRVILDGVFHHVGRDFWAFRHLQQHREQSPYRNWFAGVNFSRSSPYGDPFTYDNWNGHFNLVKLNLHNPEVRSHLFEAVKMWIKNFALDGLRLDAADAIELDFLRDLATFCRRQHSDFWLMGEVVHGDYRRWVNPSTLDAVTNYECYKGLYSSHNDRNYFEIAYSFKRQFGEQGIYSGLPLYAFADNHDVSRVASLLHQPAHLYPLYALLLTMPGVPSIYYGSEWGIGGLKQPGDDRQLRPALRWPDISHNTPHPDLVKAITRFIQIRHQSRALRYGRYQQLSVTHEQLAYARYTDQEYMIVVVNAAPTAASLNLAVTLPEGSTLIDLLEPSDRFVVASQHLQIDSVPPCWVRILAKQ